MMDIVALDRDTGQAFISAAYVGELLEVVRAFEAELLRIRDRLEQIETERRRTLTFPPITPP